MGTAKKLLIAACAIAATSFGLGAFAQEEPKYPAHEQKQPGAMMGEQMPSSQELNDLNLKVTKVDRSNNKIWFEAKIAPRATIERDNKTVSLDQLKPGDEVRASFDLATGDIMKLNVVAAPTHEKEMKDK